MDSHHKGVGLLGRLQERDEVQEESNAAPEISLQSSRLVAMPVEAWDPLK